jgi:hypothetical protein
MTGIELRALWRRALDAASEALEAGRKAETLRADFCAAELGQIRAERDWLARVDWARL